MTTYPELSLLKSFIDKNKVSIILIENDNCKCRLIPLELRIRHIKIRVYIDDEFNDLKLDLPILHVFLALRELAILDDSSDFLQWTAWCNEDASNHKLLDYYKIACSKLNDIKEFFDEGEIDYFISDLDYQLNAGAIQFLRSTQIY